MGEQLYIKGKVVNTDVGDSDVAILHIDNLGGAGTSGTVGPETLRSIRIALLMHSVLVVTSLETVDADIHMLSSH